MFGDPALLSTASGRGVVLAGMLVLVGAATCSWIAPSRALARPMRAGALLLLVGVMVQAFGQLLAFEAWAPDAAPLHDTLAIIGNTNWGHTRLAVTLIAFVGFVFSFARSPLLDMGVRVVAVALLGVLPLLGHAASSSNVPLAYALGMVHAAGAAMWLGALALLAPTWWMGLHSTLVMLPRYGRLAMFAAPLVIATGVLTVWTRLETPVQLLSTTYGRLILAKSVLVAIILAFGARHHRRLTRSFERSPDNNPARFEFGVYTSALGDGRPTAASRILMAYTARHTLLLELLLAAVVLAVTGWLGESEPPTLE